MRLVEERYVVVEADDVEFVHGLARQSTNDGEAVAIQRVPTLGIEVVTTVTLALIGGAAAIAAILQLIGAHKGGQFIDLRSTAPKSGAVRKLRYRSWQDGLDLRRSVRRSEFPNDFSIYRSKDVAFGLVIIVAVNGVVHVEAKEPKGAFIAISETLIKTVGEMYGASVEDASASITPSIGSDAQISLEVGSGS